MSDARKDILYRITTFDIIARFGVLACNPTTAQPAIYTRVYYKPFNLRLNNAFYDILYDKYYNIELLYLDATVLVRKTVFENRATVSGSAVTFDSSPTISLPLNEPTSSNTIPAGLGPVDVISSNVDGVTVYAFEGKTRFLGRQKRIRT